MRTNEGENVWLYVTAVNLPKNWVLILYCMYFLYTKCSATLMHSLELIKKKIQPWKRILSG